MDHHSTLDLPCSTSAGGQLNLRTGRILQIEKNARVTQNLYGPTHQICRRLGMAFACPEFGQNSGLFGCVRLGLVGEMPFLI